MWPGATSVRDELSVTIILVHGSFLSGAKTINGVVKPLSFLNYVFSDEKKKKKMWLGQNLQCIANGYNINFFP